MTTFKKIASTIAGLGLVVCASMAQATPVQFGITAATQTIGSGYGQETAAVEATNAATLLDVRFTNSFQAQNHTLSSVGDSWTFNLGTVDFKELSGGSAGKITADETDNLGLSWLLSFTNPLVTGSNIVASITADAGPIVDALVDYGITWADKVVDFDGGQFSIHLNNISFTDSGLAAQTQTATVTLTGLPTPLRINAQAVPEPGSLALVGLALAGLAISRRRKN